MFDLVALGESLIDFTPSGKNDLGMQLFARNPGGAPANVLAMNSKLGGRRLLSEKSEKMISVFFSKRPWKKPALTCPV